MPAIPLRYIGLALAALGIIAAAYWGWQSYNNAIERAATLEIDLAAKTAELDATKKTYEGITEGMSVNEETRVRIINRTNTIKEEIRALPVTTQCVDSLPVRLVLDRLSDPNGGGTEDSLP